MEREQTMTHTPLLVVLDVKTWTVKLSCSCGWECPVIPKDARATFADHVRRETGNG